MRNKDNFSTGDKIVLSFMAVGCVWGFIAIIIGSIILIKWIL